ncbi:hypothetical protein E2562_013417 [Oryza meyeriana var. granulata]|uniref:Uncharacterized protein n=1 Tax=Oryza meyeriana var. granulata TaxID=110450 RepID=A0A6G1EA79_9ORYZ|nr:hypothetical protein E2562_013417 [Oryza meyeriana var. granulata]
MAFCGLHEVTVAATTSKLSGRKTDQPGSGSVAAKAAAVASSWHWSALTESRIMRVSRVFGGKDRRSKVRKVKRLRNCSGDSLNKQRQRLQPWPRLPASSGSSHGGVGNFR